MSWHLNEIWPWRWRFGRRRSRDGALQLEALHIGPFVRLRWWLVLKEG